MLLAEGSKNRDFKSRPWKPSVVIPALNEVGTIEGTLGSVIRAVDAFDGRAPISVFIVDNGSTDGTPAAVRDLTSSRDNFHLISEPRRGPGHARRRGAKAAIQYGRKASQHGESWIINTDADVTVPEQWLLEWFALFQGDNPGIVVGNIKMPDTLAVTHPNAYKVMQTVGRYEALAEEIFGVTNTHGNHFAVASDSYRVIGPFKQPYENNPEGKRVIVTGEDWDMGTRARTLEMTIARSPHTPVTASPRRFYANPQGFLDGSIYAGEFQRVDANGLPEDIDKSQVDQLVSMMTYNSCNYHISKPLLANPLLIDNPKVQQFLGQQLRDEIKQWIDRNPIQNIFQDRNGFILHVDLFHEEFGDIINRLLLAQE